MQLLEMFDLTEARRNPEINHKSDIVSDLAPYRDDPTVFIAFVSDAGKTSHVARGRYAGLSGKGRDTVNTPALSKAARTSPESKVRNGSGIKIGVNPRPQSNETPAGVYAYPLADVWDDLVADTLKFGKKPFVALLRSRGHLLELANYSDADLKADIAALTPLVTEMVDGEVETAAAFDFWMRGCTTPGASIWSITRNIAMIEAEGRHGGDNAFTAAKAKKSAPVLWNALLRALGYAGVVDRDGQAIMHLSEPTQAVFLDAKAYSVVKAFDNRRPSESK